jgi:hypothetical protein
MALSPDGDRSNHRREQESIVDSATGCSGDTAATWNRGRSVSFLVTDSAAGGRSGWRVLREISAAAGRRRKNRILPSSRLNAAPFWH